MIKNLNDKLFLIGIYCELFLTYESLIRNIVKLDKNLDEETYIKYNENIHTGKKKEVGFNLCGATVDLVKKFDYILPEK
jgi:hypothetical protein